MSKKQFYTVGQHHNSNQISNINTRKHKFSNFVNYANNLPVSASHATEANSHTSQSKGFTNSIRGNYAQNNSSKDKSEPLGSYNLGKNDGNFVSNNAKINQLGQFQGSIPSTHVNPTKLNDETNSQQKKTPMFPQQNILQKAPTNLAMTAPKKQVETVRIQEKCAICGTLTEKCCGLCRRVFYCSGQHQEIDWHTRHKFECLGRQAQQQRANTEAQEKYGSESTNKFIFYSNNTQQTKNNEAYQKQIQYQAVQRFLELLQQRLILRSKIMGQTAKINERTAIIVRQSLVKQGQQLLELSQRITHQQFKPSFSRKITKKDILEYSSQQWGSEITVSQNGVALQYYADLVLMAKLYHLCGLSKETRESVIAIGRLLEDSQQKVLFLSNQMSKYSPARKKLSLDVQATPIAHTFTNGKQYGTTNGKMQQGQQFGITKSKVGRIQDPLQVSKSLILQSILQLSQFYNIDKTSESVYKLYIKKIQIEEGVWEQIYAYFNMGAWYMRKTYFDKSIKSFLYSLELLESHKKGSAESAIFKADCLFNISQAYWALGDQKLAIQKMQQSYRVRVNTIGKNSMECSYCLYSLSKWYRQLQKWNQCVQYMDECLRIRKLYQNQPNYEGKLEQIKLLIAAVHKTITNQKKKTQLKLDPKSEKYFSQILQKEKQEEKRIESKLHEQGQLLPKGTVASRLFRDDKQYVKFKVNMSVELWETISSNQAKFLGDLLELSDKKMEKHQAIRILTQSPFVSSLTNEQRDQFMAENSLKNSQHVQ